MLGDFLPQVSAQWGSTLRPLYSNIKERIFPASVYRLIFPYSYYPLTINCLIIWRRAKIPPFTAVV